MTGLTRLSSERLNLMMRGDEPPDPVLLLGAGASVKSGVPLAGDLVSMAAIWGYCKEHGRNFADPRIVRSDWWPWLCNQGWFHPEEPLSDQYPRAVERLLRPREARREFFLQVLNSAQGPSLGYHALAKLMAANAIKHVLTVNFDDMVARACDESPQVLRVESVAGPTDLVKFTLAPTYPQVVHLHGTVGRYEDRNLEEETQTLDVRMREAVMPLLRDHPLVVLGYRGTEPSIMRDLLLRGSEQINAYRHGVFWCVRPGDDPGHQVMDLAGVLGSNFTLVEIAGFDEAMLDWGGNVRPAPAPRITSDKPHLDIPDIRPDRALQLADLDRVNLMSQLGEYARRMDLMPLTGADDAALMTRLLDLRLARSDHDTTVLTRASGLLFGPGDRTRIEIRAGDIFMPISGHIFRVLDQTLEALTELNAPIRLKGVTSEDVRRFHSRAIKEVVVNALVHRDHDRPEPVRVTVSGSSLVVTSPGSAVRELPLEMIGTRGVRAYRNPVLADLMYGCGDMDKRGSGLADIVRWTRQVGGKATFDPCAEGSDFRVTITARELETDPVTRTADPGDLEHFMCNALPVSMNDTIYVTTSTVRSRSEIFDAHPNVQVPPFAFSPDGLMTFDNPSTKGSVFSEHARGGIRVCSARELALGADGLRHLAQLLNASVFTWARQRGLSTDVWGRRLWFPRSDDGPTEITYTARVREATRTVTRPNISRTTGAVRYWEHEAIRFSFRRLGLDWILHLVPTIVFTKDGNTDLLKGPKVGPLVTRRMARDFNQQVQNDLYFWRWVFARGERAADLGEGVRLQAEFVACDIVDAPAATEGFHSDETEADFDDEVGDEVAELALDQGVDAESEEET
jgi:NAD-dependent SIR2 family protein deacetylase